MIKKALYLGAMSALLSTPTIASSEQLTLHNAHEATPQPAHLETLQQAAKLRAQLPQNQTPNFSVRNTIAELYEKAAHEAHSARDFDAVKDIIQKITTLGKEFHHRATNLGTLASPNTSPKKKGSPTQK